ncbi:AAA family ATPase, partial [Staphylococcus arlettae]
PKYRKPFLLKKFREVERDKNIFVLNSAKEVENFKIKGF